MNPRPAPTRPETEPARQDRARDAEHRRPALLTALSLLTTNPSDPLFGDVHGALQLARAVHTTCLTTLAKAALPPRVVAVLDEPPQAQPTARSPFSLEGSHSASQGVAEGARSHNCRGSARTIWHARALCCAHPRGRATAGFAILEALQNEDYVLTHARHRTAGSCFTEHRRWARLRA
jgi:hypothetical protein